MKLCVKSIFFSTLEWLVKHYFKAYFVETKQRKFIIILSPKTWVNFFEQILYNNYVESIFLTL